MRVKQTTRLQRLGEKLINPSPHLLSAEQHEQARLLTSSTTVILIFLIISVPIWLLIAPDTASTLNFSIGLAVAVFSAHALSHSRYYRLGAGLLSLTLLFMIIISVFVAPGPVTSRTLALKYLIIAVMVSGFFLSQRFTAVIVLASLAIIGALFFTPDLPQEVVFSQLIFFLVVISLGAVHTALNAHYKHKLAQSEARYRAIVETQTELVCRYLPDGTLTFVNDAYCNYFGKKREELLGCNFLELIPVAQREGAQQHIRSLLRELNVIKEYEHEVLLPTGETRWQAWVDRALCDEQGRVLEFQAVGRDVSERKRQERALLQAQQRYYGLFEQGNDAVFIVSLDGRHLEANRRAAQMLGYSVEELLNLRVGETSAEAEESNEILQCLLRGEHVPVYERLLRRKDGTVIPVEINAELVRDPDGRPLHIQSVVRDISMRKAQEEQLRLQSAALEAAANAILITDPQGIILWSNAAYTQLTGFSAEEARGQNQCELLRSELQDEAYYEQVRATIAAGHIWQGKAVNRRKDGTLYTEEQTITPVKDTNGRVTHLIAVKQDITEREHAEAALRESEARQRAMITAIPDLIFRHNLDGTYLDYHLPDPDLLGFPPERLLGKNISDFFPVEMAQSLFSTMRQVVESGQMAICELDLRLKTRIRSFELRMVPTGNDEIISIARDMTEIKQTRRELEKAKARLELLIETARITWWEMDVRTGNFVTDPRKMTLLGYDPQAFTGASPEQLSLLLHPDDREMALEQMASMLNSCESTWAFDYRIRAADGRYLWFHDRGDLVTENGRPIIRGFSIDINERKQAEQRAFELALEKERARLLVQFIQTASHEFKTPLTIINTNAYLLKRMPDPEARAHKVEQIQQQVRRINHLVEMLLITAKLENGFTLTMAPLDVGAVLAAACHRVARSYQHQRALTLPQSLNLPLVTGNADYLATALEQLLDNAYRFTPANGSIQVAGGATDTHVWLEVSDSGPGIETENLTALFETFWRQDEAHSTPGFGLGLSITKKIVEKHSGYIEVHSEPRKGSAFRIYLPRMKSEATEPEMLTTRR